VDHSGGWITQAGGSHAESGQTEYIMLLVICSDFLHFCIFCLFRFYIFCARTHTHTLVRPAGLFADSQTEYIMLLVICLDFLHFHFSSFYAFSVSTSSAHAHTHAHVLCIAVSAGVRLVSAKEPYSALSPAA
jgi:hypothetical protein